MRSVGENPLGGGHVGHPRSASRYWAVIASGRSPGWAASTCRSAVVHSFNQNMTVGTGFIALAVVIFGGWQPVGALAAACCSASRAPSRSGCRSLAAPPTLFQACPTCWR